MANTPNYHTAAIKKKYTSEISESHRVPQFHKAA